MASEIAARLRALIDSGQLQIIAGKIVDVVGDSERARVAIRRCGVREIEHLDVSRIISCNGVTGDPGRNANPLVESLFAQNLARTDPPRVGIDVDAHCAVIDGQGRASRRLFAIGPMSRAAF
jgi:uncharacterized NAD(P)/FAD-binding protein YdhS